MPFLVAAFLVFAPVGTIGQLHKEGVVNLEQFPPKIEKENIRWGE